MMRVTNVLIIEFLYILSLIAEMIMNMGKLERNQLFLLSPCASDFTISG